MPISPNATALNQIVASMESDLTLRSTGREPRRHFRGAILHRVHLLTDCPFGN